MSKVLIVAEHDGETLNISTARAVRCATDIGSDVTVAVFSDAGQGVAEQAARLQGVGRVLLVRRPENSAPVAALWAPQVAHLAQEFSHVLAPSTTFGKDLMPRVAALLDVDAITDIMRVVDEHTFVRPIYAGNALLTLRLPETVKVIGTVRSASYKAVPEGDSPAAVEVKALDAALPSHTRYVELRQQASERPDLQSATKVISGGRGMGNGENFEIIYRVADKIGAAVGASRAAVDAGFVPNDMQVGQTGKVIAPELYIAVGISGAIQHLAGIKDAGTIVAINNDPDAPIFEVADIGLVADLFEAIPALEAALPG